MNSDTVNSDVWARNCAALAEVHPGLARDMLPLFSAPPAPLPAPPVSPENIASSMRGRLENPAILIVLGTGDIRALAEYSKNPHPLQRQMIVIEKSFETMARAMASADITPLIKNPDVRFLIGMNPEDLKTSLRFRFQLPVMRPLLRSVKTVRISGYVSAEEADYYQRAEAIVKESSEAVSRMSDTQAIDAYAALMQLITNREAFDKFPSVGGLGGAFAGSTGIVVSTGPSLNRRIDLLRRMEGRAVVYAADSAFPILRDAGIKPHFVGVVERLTEIARYFCGCKEEKDSYLVASPLVSPSVLDAYGGPVLALFRDIPPVSWFYPASKGIFTGESVAHMGVGLLRHFGCDPLVLVGQDLCYDRNSGVSHAEGMPYQTVFGDMANAATEAWIEGNGGEPVRSSESWRRFRDVLSDMIKVMGIRCINVIEGDRGAVIPGTLRADPDGFDLPPTAFDIRARLAERVASLSPTAAVGDALAKTVHALEEYASSCSALFEKAAGVAAHPDSIEGDYDALLDKKHGVYGSLLYHLAQPKVYRVAEELVVARGENLCDADRAKKRRNLIMDGLASGIFWARQIAHTLNEAGKR